MNGYSNESQFVTPEQWAACYSPEVQRLAEGDRRRLVLGADASTSRDLTALVGTSLQRRNRTKLKRFIAVRGHRSAAYCAAANPRSILKQQSALRYCACMRRA